MSEKKRILILKASNDVCAAEIDHLVAIANMYSMESVIFEIKTSGDLDQLRCMGKFDYVYLAAHANPHSFGTESNSVQIYWSDFGLRLCESQCLNQECILMLGCCRGGLKSVAVTLFSYCEQIDYVCGPRWSPNQYDLLAGFHVFIYNMESRGEQPSTAIKRASKATGYDFFCYDKIEVEERIDFAAELTGADVAGIAAIDEAAGYGDIAVGSAMCTTTTPPY